MALGLVEVLTSLAKCKPLEIIEPKYKSSYHKAPSKEHAKTFRKLGRKIVKLSDIPLMLKLSFK